MGESKVAAKATQGVGESAVRLAQKSESALLKYEVKETAQAVEISLQKASLEKTTIAEKIQAFLENPSPLQAVIDPKKTHSGKSLVLLEDKKMYQIRDHFNKHGRAMGYADKKSYEKAAREFFECYQSHPEAKIVEGKLNRRCSKKDEMPVTRVVEYDGISVCVDVSKKQVVDFYIGSEHRQLIEQIVIREGK